MRQTLLLIIVLVASLATATTVSGQNYLSKPTAVKNLSDEVRYIKATLPLIKESDPNEFTTQRQRLRLIESMMRDLKTAETVDAVATKYLPDGNTRNLQVGVAVFAPPSGYSNHLAWLREDLMQLITF